MLPSYWIIIGVLCVFLSIIFSYWAYNCPTKDRYVSLILAAICTAMVFYAPFGYQSSKEKLEDNDKKSSYKSTPADILPTRFNPDDPRLKFVRIYDLKKEVGSSTFVGKCPNKPCFRLMLRSIDLYSEPPQFKFGISGSWNGFYSKRSEGSAVALILPIKKGCGGTIRTPDLELIFEIKNDTVSIIRAWAAIKSGMYDVKGLYIVEAGCK